MIRIQAIGTVVVRVGRSRVSRDSPMLFALALFLGLTAGQTFARSDLLELFWPDAKDSDRRHSLRQLLYQLRAFGLPVPPDSEELFIEPGIVSSDLSAVLDAQWPECADDAAVRAAAEILPGYSPVKPVQFREWIDQLRAQAAAQFRRAVLRRIGAARADGRWTEVHDWSQLCLNVDPLNEEAVLAMAEATAMSGGKAQALGILDNYLTELGDRSLQIGLPATILRRRVSEQFVDAPSGAAYDRLLIGRDEEIRALLTHLANTRSNRGSCVEISGPAGIGKSRLAGELIREAGLRGFAHCSVRLHSTDQSRPFAVLLDAVPTLMELPGALGCSAASMSTLRRLVEHDRRTGDDATEAADTTEIEVRLHRIRVAVLDLLGAISEECPLLVFVDDFQHIDGASRTLLDDLVRESSSQRVLWLMTRRTTDAGATPARVGDATTVMELDALSEESCRKLIAMAIKAIDEKDRDQLLNACRSIGGGNPFFIREILANWDANHRFDRLPDSIAQAVSRRVARLGGPALRTLQCSALLGGLATVGRVARVLQASVTESLDAVAELASAGISNMQDAESSLLLHDLWRDEVTRIIGAATAQVLHSRIADVLEEEGQPRRTAALLWEAARHRAAAGEPERAIALLEDCAEHLMSIGLPEEAAETFGRAELLCRTDADRFRNLSARIRALDAVGRWEGFDGLIQQARALASRLDPAYDPHDELELTETELLFRRDVDPIECLRRAAACSEHVTASLDHRLKALRIRAIVADNLCDDGELLRSHALILQLVAARPEHTAARLVVEIVYHTTLGNLENAVEYCRDLIALERSRGSVVANCRALRFISYPLRILGDFAQCRHSLRESLDLAEKYRLAAEATTLCDVLATIALEHGDLDEANVWVDRATNWAKNVDANLERFATRLLRAQLTLAKGNPQETVAILGDDLGMCATEPIPRKALNVLCALTEAYVTLNRVDDVRRVIPLIQRRLSETLARGRQDPFVRALCRAQLLVGDVGEVHDFVTTYLLLQRRDRTPVPADLVALAAPAKITRVRR